MSARRPKPRRRPARRTVPLDWDTVWTVRSQVEDASEVVDRIVLDTSRLRLTRKQRAAVKRIHRLIASAYSDLFDAVGELDDLENAIVDAEDGR